MLEFYELTLSDKEMIQAYTRRWNLELADLSFPNMYMWRLSHNIRFCIEEEVLYVTLCHRKAPCFFFVPLPWDTNASLEIPLKKLEEYSASLGEPLRVKSATQAQREKIDADCPGCYEWYWDEGTFDYVYRQEDLAELRGKKYHGKRNHIKQFLAKYPQAEYLPLQPEHVDACLQLYSDWAQKKADTLDDSVEDEWLSVNEALRNFQALGLIGGVVMVDGELQAFTVGELLTPSLGLTHIEKANVDMHGLFPYINQQLARNEFKDMEFINREEDMGLVGLRKAKESYKPIKMIGKYSLRKAGETRL